MQRPTPTAQESVAISPKSHLGKRAGDVRTVSQVRANSGQEGRLPARHLGLAQAGGRQTQI
jgi:hypothetical protein